MFQLRFYIMAWSILIAMINTGLIGPVRVQIQESYGIDEMVFGILLSAVQFGGTISVLLSAPKLRRYNPFYVFIIGLFLVAIGLFECFSVQTLPGWIFGWLLISFGLSLGAIVNNVAMDLWPQNPRQGVVMLHGINSIGKIAGPLLPVIFVSCFAISDWRWSFLTMSIICLAIFLLFLVWGRKGSARFHKANKEKSGSNAVLGFRVFKNPLYWMAVIPIGLISGSEFAFVTLMPAYFIKTKGVSASMASLLLSIHLIGLMIGRFAFAFPLSKLRNNTVIAITLTSGLALFPAIFFSNLWIAGIALAVFGITFSATWPTYYAQARQFFPDDSEMFAYGINLFNWSGLSLGIMASSVVTRYSFTGAMIFSVAVMWAFGAYYFLGPISKGPGRKQKTEEPALEPVAIEQ